MMMLEDDPVHKRQEIKIGAKKSPICLPREVKTVLGSNIDIDFRKSLTKPHVKFFCFSIRGA